MTADGSDPVEAQALTPADITRIAETEGSQAADAALQRMVRAREAGALSDIDSVEDLLGEIELDAGAATEVVEHLGELHAAAEDTPIDKIEREKPSQPLPKKKRARKLTIVNQRLSLMCLMKRAKSG